MTASIAAHAIGPPPKVVPRDSGFRVAVTFADSEQRGTREAVAERLGAS